MTRPEKVAEQQREKEIIKRRLAALAEKSQTISHFIETNIQRFNGTPGDTRSFDQLDTLLDRQPYRLSYWRVAADEINYRRFFDINELAGLCMEREEVFVAAHELILKFLAQGCATGLRIDHPDGLYDPEQYLRRLQYYYIDAIGRKIHAADPAFNQTPWAEWQPLLHAEADQLLQQVSGPPAWPLYVVVEKILGIGEPLPENWATHGTSGYDFLNYLNGLFVDSAHANEMTRIYQEWIGERALFSDMVVEKKTLDLTNRPVE